MKISEIFRPMIRLFQSKNHKLHPARWSLEEVFSYKIGEPDDEETREAFKRLKERKRELVAGKNKLSETDTDKD